MAFKIGLIFGVVAAIVIVRAIWNDYRDMENYLKNGKYPWEDGNKL